MREQRYFLGITLMGFGLYFFLKEVDYQLYSGFYSWQTLLLLIGIALLVQGYLGKQTDYILPGVILTGYGLHQYLIGKLAIWTNDSGIIFLLIAFGLLLQAIKKRTSKLTGLIFLFIATCYIFYNSQMSWSQLLRNDFSYITQYWPILLILFGGFVLFKKK